LGFDRAAQCASPQAENARRPPGPMGGRAPGASSHRMSTGISGSDSSWPQVACCPDSECLARAPHSRPLRGGFPTPPGLAPCHGTVGRVLFSFDRGPESSGGGAGPQCARSSARTADAAATAAESDGSSARADESAAMMEASETCAWIGVYIYIYIYMDPRVRCVCSVLMGVL
jgi:hypothetical protein